MWLPVCSGLPSTAERRFASAAASWVEANSKKSCFAARINVGFGYSGREYLGSLTVNYSDEAFFSQGINPSYYGYADAYTLVGGRIGRRWNNGRLTTSIKALNLLDDEARQHVFGDILRRTLMFEVKYRY